ncbi:MAG: hypothetical protein ACRBBO_01990 [Cognatishimia sp.]
MTLNFLDNNPAREQQNLIDDVLKIHDAVPNGEKRKWVLLAKAVTDEMDLGQSANPELLGASLIAACQERLNSMVIAVKAADATFTHKQALDAVQTTDLGRLLIKVRDTAEAAAIEASELSKQLHGELSERDAYKRITKKAKDIQIAKAKAGFPVSLLTAMELAKAMG